MFQRSFCDPNHRFFLVLLAPRKVCSVFIYVEHLVVLPLDTKKDASFYLKDFISQYSSVLGGGVKPFGPFLRSAYFTLIHLESNCLGLLILFSLKACLISHLLYFSPKSSGLLIYLTKSHPRLPLLSGYPEEPHGACCRISLK